MQEHDESRLECREPGLFLMDEFDSEIRCEDNGIYFNYNAKENGKCTLNTARYAHIL